MAIVDLTDLPPLLKTGQRLAGLDVGTKTIGVALSDVMRSLATPLETIKRGKFLPDAQRLFDIVRRYDVGAFVIGLPLALDGSEGPRCQSVRQFAANLLQVQDMPIAFQDERMSTAAVQRVLIEEIDMTRRRRAEVVDRAAAAYILQGALDRLANLARHPPPPP